jgi:membrane-associated progesterone receptor component
VPLGDEYQKARDEFDPMYYLIGFALFMLFFYLFNRDKQGTKKE